MRRSGSSSSRRRVSSIPSSSPRRMSTSATSGASSSTSRAALGRGAGRADDVAALAAEQQLEALAQRLVVFDEDEAQGTRRCSIGRRREP